MGHCNEIDEVASITHTAITIVETISRGRTYSILKARRGTKYVILKVANVPDAMFTEILRREYELCFSLTHSSIVSTFGFEELPDVGAAIVMEYIEGVTLDKFIASQPSYQARERVMRDILTGVDYLHHRSLLHNDLKPQNIIITPNGAARIIDFGLSSSHDSLWCGCIGGTDGFTAPEILRDGVSHGVASDIYSVGRLMEYIFAGRRYRHIVQRCLKADVSQRYSSIGALQRDMRLYNRRPWIALSVVAFVVIIFAIAVPYINKAYEQRRHIEYRDDASKELNSYYDTALHIIHENSYVEFAVVARGFYSVHFLEYRDALPSDRHLAAEEVFSEHIHHLDSLIMTLPSFYDLPPKQCDSIYVVLEQLSKEYLD